MSDDTKIFVYDLLKDAIGEDAIKSLISRKSSVMKNEFRDTIFSKPDRYLRDEEEIFVDFIHPDTGQKHHQFPKNVIKAINDAGEEFNYSNWHNGHYSLAIEIIYRYCNEHKIDMETGKPISESEAT